MKDFLKFLDEEVFDYYIVKGTTSKGKVVAVGTERHVKLKYKKPDIMRGHVFVKSRKRDLHIGDTWKKTYWAEEVEINEGAKFSASQIKALKTEYSKLQKIDPESPTYKKMKVMLGKMSKDQLKQIKDAKIKFLQFTASDLLRKMGEEVGDSWNEDVEVDEKHGGPHVKKKLKFKTKQLKHLKPKEKKKGHGSYGRFSDTSGGFSFMKPKSGSGYVGAYNSVELDGEEQIEEEKDWLGDEMPRHLKILPNILLKI